MIIPHIVLRLLLIFILASIISFKEVEASEIILAIFMLTILSFSTVAHINILINGCEAAHYMNELINFNRNSGKVLDFCFCKKFVALNFSLY